jgi:hypothetical protein
LFHRYFDRLNNKNWENCGDEIQNYWSQLAKNGGSSIVFDRSNSASTLISSTNSSNNRLVFSTNRPERKKKIIRHCHRDELNNNNATMLVSNY